MLIFTNILIVLSLQLLLGLSSALSIPEITSLTNETATRRLVCYQARSIVPRISEPDDCGIAVRAVIAESPRAVDPESWGPDIEKYKAWTWGSCALLLKPNSIQSYDTFSRLKLAEEASRVVTGCVNPAHQFKGGYTSIGPKGVFTLAVMGRPRPGLVERSERHWSMQYL
jgi:hypothetical protein